MVAKYYVAMRPQTNEHHSVHKEDCPFLPEDGRRIYLGIFQSPEDALEEGRKYFSRSDSCLFCSKERLPKNKKPVVSGMQVAENFISSDGLTITWESVLQCSVN
jgi:hypothetical protein